MEKNKQLKDGYFMEETSMGFFLCKNHNNQIIRSREIRKNFVDFINSYKYKSVDEALKVEINKTSSNLVKDAIRDIDHQIKDMEFKEYLDKKTEEIKREQEERYKNIWKNKN